jgi:hypothetical protein
MLSNWLPGTLACTLIDYAAPVEPFASIEPVVVQVGRPLYYAFNPMGASQVFAHVNEDELKLVDFEANLSADIALEGFVRPGDFAAPVWRKDNRVVVVMAKAGEANQYLVMFDLPSLDTAVEPTPAERAATKPKTPTSILMKTLAAFAQGLRLCAQDLLLFFSAQHSNALLMSSVVLDLIQKMMKMKKRRSQLFM